MEKEKKAAISRHGDQKYYVSKILSKKYHMMYPNVDYTQEDAQKKLEILEISNNKTCFISGGDCKGVGDHLYEINGYHRYTGQRGIDNQWNILPVCGVLNKTYKRFKFVMPDGNEVSKDIGYQNLTVDEYLFLSNSQNEEYYNMAYIFTKVFEWKEYVKSRGAYISYNEPPEFIEIRNNFHEKYKKMWNETFIDIDKITI